MAWPRAAAGLAHPADTSLATFRGHAVLVTLVRARLSPPAAGGAHVYAGSADGCVRVWDVATGEITRTLDHHADVVRDVSWSPSAPGVLATASFDGSIVRWGPTGEGEGAERWFGAAKQCKHAHSPAQSSSAAHRCNNP